MNRMQYTVIEDGAIRFRHGGNGDERRRSEKDMRQKIQRS